ncbi:MAG: DUF58 domain-containing protein [Gammaproteobacteria bacterium]
MITTHPNATITGASLTLEQLIQLRPYAQGLPLGGAPSQGGAMGGQQLTRLPGRGMEFVETRQYIAGDDIRTLDWRVTARTGKPHTKIFQEERERPLWLLIDLRPNMFFGSRTAFKSVTAVQLAALMGWAAILQGHRVGALILHDTLYHIKPKSRPQGLLPLLKQLAHFTQQPPTIQHNAPSLTQTLQQWRLLVRSGSLLCILSDFSCQDTHLGSCLQQISRHHRIMPFFIYDDVEKNPPPPQRYPISNGIDTLTMDTRSQHFRKAYYDRFQTHRQTLQQQCHRAHLKLCELATHQPALFTLRHYLEQIQ